jgi:glutamate synthase (NADPH/NADH) small chain
MFLVQPVKFIAGENGKLSAVECIRMELGEPDARGRRRPVPVNGTNFLIDTDTAVLALGYLPFPTIAETTPGLETDEEGMIIADPSTGATSRPGVFAGGDAVNGPDLVVTAVASGRTAASGIDNFLRTQA